MSSSGAEILTSSDADAAITSTGVPVEIEGPSSTERGVPVEIEGPSSTARGNLQVFPYEKLVKATKNFKKRRLIGKGGFGDVYRGVFKEKFKWKDAFKGLRSQPGQVVAIKRHRIRTNGQEVTHFNTEIDTLSQFDHPNIVKLLGYSEKGPERLLVYEYMPMGSLDSFIHGTDETKLNWSQRISVALGIARAIEYLHNGGSIGGRPFVFRDLKLANVLLGEGYIPKLADFGGVRLIPDSLFAVTKEVAGTPGYIDPYYAKTLIVAPSNDLFSLGIILLELLTGRLPLDSNNDGLDKWARNITESDNVGLDLADLSIRAEASLASFRCLFIIAVQCTAKDYKERPGIEDIVKLLEALKREVEEKEEVEEEEKKSEKKKGKGLMIWKG